MRVGRVTQENIARILIFLFIAFFDGWRVYGNKITHTW